MQLYACHSDDYVRIQGELPLDSIGEIRVVNYINGKEVYKDSLSSNSFDFEIDTVATGVYQVVFSWDRDVLSEKELKARVKYDIQGLPQYYLTKLLWVQKGGSVTFKLRLQDTETTQEDIEEAILSGDDAHITFATESNRENAQYFEGYLSIGDDYRVRNAIVKDSLRNVLYQLIDENNLAEANALSKKLQEYWWPDVKGELIQAEVDYLLTEPKQALFPYILYMKVRNKQDFEGYAKVYDAVIPEVREKISHLYKPYMSQSGDTIHRNTEK